MLYLPTRQAPSPIPFYPAAIVALASVLQSGRCQWRADNLLLLFDSTIQLNKRDIQH